MHIQLPKKLGAEPLLEAIVEIRFDASTSVSDVLPGFLFGKLGGIKKTERLQAADIPKPIRDSDPNLKYVPLIRLSWDQFTVSIGDCSVVIGCNIPYPGWNAFKESILNVTALIFEIEIIQSITRCSIKYVDLIPAKELNKQISKINGKLILGGHTLRNEVFSFKIEIPENGVVHVVSIVSSATATLSDGSYREGVVIETDTIRNMQAQEPKRWLESLADNLDDLHTANKQRFFSCLTPEAIQDMEPSYE
jgi:uncharacterized protein (TIGR04255 family)